MLGNRLGVTFDWYEKKTLDWLVQPTGLGIWGTGAPYINGGDIKNTGESSTPVPCFWLPGETELQGDSVRVESHLLREWGRLKASLRC